MLHIRGLLLAVPLAACVAPTPDSAPDEEGSSSSVSFGDDERSQSRHGRRELRGGRIQVGEESGDAYACAAGKTGPNCTWTCDPGARAACGYTEYRESDGRVTGFLARRASLFRTRASEAASSFVTWVTSDPTTLGLRSDLTAEDLDVSLFNSAQHGRFSLISLEQRYRGLPILGPEARIVLSGRGQDIRSSVARSSTAGSPIRTLTSSARSRWPPRRCATTRRRASI